MSENEPSVIKLEVTGVKFTVTDKELLANWIMTNYSEGKAGKKYWEAMENWATSMETKFDAGENPDDFIDETFAEAAKCTADTIPRLGFYHAAYLLTDVWKYGPELLKWWRSKLDAEDADAESEIDEEMKCPNCKVEMIDTGMYVRGPDGKDRCIGRCPDCHNMFVSGKTTEVFGDDIEIGDDFIILPLLRRDECAGPCCKCGGLTRGGCGRVKVKGQWRPLPLCEACFITRKDRGSDPQEDADAKTS